MEVDEDEVDEDDEVDEVEVDEDEVDEDDDDEDEEDDDAESEDASVSTRLESPADPRAKAAVPVARLAAAMITATALLDIL